MIITDDGYSIRQDIQRNQIIISLPQTWKTTQSTLGHFNNERKLEISEEDEILLLKIVKLIYEVEGEENAGKN